MHDGDSHIRMCVITKGELLNARAIWHGTDGSTSSASRPVLGRAKFFPLNDFENIVKNTRRRLDVNMKMSEEHT